MRTLLIATTIALLALLLGCQTVDSYTPLDDSPENEGSAGETVPVRYDLAYLVRGLLGKPGHTIVSFSDDSLVETPWFAVRAIVLQMRKSADRTRIILPERGILTSTMKHDPYVVVGEEYHSSGVRFRLAVGVHTGDFDPFLARHLVDDFRADGWTPSKSAVRSAGSE